MRTHDNKFRCDLANIQFHFAGWETYLFIALLQRERENGKGTEMLQIRQSVNRKQRRFLF